MSKKRNDKESDLFNAETKPKFLCLPYIKQRKNILEKKLFTEKTF